MLAECWKQVDGQYHCVIWVESEDDGDRITDLARGAFEHTAKSAWKAAYRSWRMSVWLIQ